MLLCFTVVALAEDVKPTLTVEKITKERDAAIARVAWLEQMQQKCQEQYGAALSLFNAQAEIIKVHAQEPKPEPKEPAK